MDNGRRSFLQGRDLLSNVIAGYVDANMESNTSVLASSNASPTSNTFYWKANTTTSNYVMFKQPDYKGYWELVPLPYSFRVATLHKPAWLQRKMIKLFFGWTWHEGKLN
jgi:hypothetical protein